MFPLKDIESQVPVTAKTILKGQESFVDAYSCFFDNLKQVITLFEFWYKKFLPSEFYQSCVDIQRPLLHSEWVHVERRAPKGRHHRLVSLRTCYGCLRWQEPCLFLLTMCIWYTNIYRVECLPCFGIGIQDGDSWRRQQGNFQSGLQYCFFLFSPPFCSNDVIIDTREWRIQKEKWKSCMGVSSLLQRLSPISL